MVVFPTESTSSVALLPSARLSHSSVVFGTRLMIFGGHFDTLDQDVVREDALWVLTTSSPPTPLRLRLQGVGPNAFSFGWEKVRDADRYVLQMRKCHVDDGSDGDDAEEWRNEKRRRMDIYVPPSEACEWRNVGTTRGPACVVTSLQAFTQTAGGTPEVVRVRELEWNGEYEVRAAGVNSLGSSGWSEALHISFFSPLLNPSPPSPPVSAQLSQEKNSGVLLLSWSHPDSEKETLTYRVLLSVRPSPQSSPEQSSWGVVFEGAARRCPISVSQLFCAVVYESTKIGPHLRLEIRARNRNGSGPPLNVFCVNHNPSFPLPLPNQAEKS
jgi:hypothetical protein